MDNFLVNPLPFLLLEVPIDNAEGALRRQRASISVSGDYFKLNEDLAVVECDIALDVEECTALLQAVHQHLAHVLQLQVLHCSLYPIRVGIIKVGNAFDHDFLASSSPYFINGSVVSVGSDWVTRGG
ncbi:hypothetical protein GUJ93_ZPchr0012g18966 [Zizania palustris]|uniref:DUF7597 domain-containing protein n=1 Tax=Zizania palustris TaxID=103762 RepID=A0A8J5WQ49_ZIZPA|nr:hypothetical protein GUJ93_ZPchr0012g18966 [Zizania palustris]